MLENKTIVFIYTYLQYLISISNLVFYIFKQFSHTG